MNTEARMHFENAVAHSRRGEDAEMVAALNAANRVGRPEPRWDDSKWWPFYAVIGIGWHFLPLLMLVR